MTGNASVRTTTVRLPADVARPFEVFVNGVPQREGTDYRVLGDALVFDDRLEQEGRLGFWRWLLMGAGVVGSYRKNDSVDVVYEVGGERRVASGLPLA